MASFLHAICTSSRYVDIFNWYHWISISKSLGFYILKNFKAAEDPEFETFYTKRTFYSMKVYDFGWLFKIKLMKIISSQKGIAKR